MPWKKKKKGYTKQKETKSETPLRDETFSWIQKPTHPFLFALIPPPLIEQMVRGGKVSGKIDYRKRVRSKKGDGSDDSDEDYVVSDDGEGVSDCPEDYGLDECASEESFDCFIEEEEEIRRLGNLIDQRPKTAFMVQGEMQAKPHKREVGVGLYMQKHWNKQKNNKMEMMRLLKMMMRISIMMTMMRISIMMTMMRISIMMTMMRNLH
ncbi:hypothetical protein Lalb_Chr15g0077561 [Lupinus albus]|uniref:Uncharacterized protein n=1 Tax=Lupinus albus TaxID=3870 RepID=A0A6A4PE34_LUPAL|nr:hypothetical protein Lalb_Chr15g0077561 [Lupinus albus]